MKGLCLAGLIAFFSTTVLSQIIDTKNSRTVEGFTGFQSNGLWGFLASDSIFIPAMYDEIGDFGSGVCPVRIGDFWGVINWENKLIVPAEYDEISYFKNGYSYLKKEDKYLLVDSMGKLLNGIPYDFVSFPSKGRSFILELKDKFGVLDYSLNVKVPFVYDIITDANEGMLAVKQNDKWGYLDSTGALVYDIQSTVPYYFRCGENIVRKEEGNTLKFVSIDKNGHEFPYTDRVTIFNDYEEDSITGNIQSIYGLINANGEVLISPYYDIIYPFSEGLAAVVKNDSIGYIDSTGKIIIPLTLYYNPSIYPTFSEDFAVVGNEEGKRGFIDKSGKLVIPFDYDMATDFKNGLASVHLYNRKKQTATAYLIDKNNKRVTRKYGSIYEFSEGLAAVRKKGKAGFVNRKEKTVIPFVYDYTGSFQNGIAGVQKNEKWGFINKEGELIVDYKYDYIQKEGDYISVAYRIGEVTLIYGLMDSTGKEITSVKYRNIESIGDNLYRVMTPDKEGWQRYGIINSRGEEIVPPNYTSVIVMDEDCFCLMRDNDNYILVDKAGKEIIK